MKHKVRNVLAVVRRCLALVFFLGITLLLCDFTGVLHTWLGWMAKVQLLPAVLALNFVTVAVLVILTLIFGRVYCSVICPLGVMQDLINRLSASRKGKKYRLSYSPAKNWLRYGLLALFVIAMVAGATSLAGLLAPYSTFGRIVSNLFAPLYRLGNNMLALLAERLDSYAFYSTEVWLKSLPTFIAAALAFVLIFILSWRGGRTWCNTVCPVGTVLGVLSRFSLLRINIDKNKCNRCGLCSRQCKASCINGKEHKVDYSRCVACFDCLETCRHGAISYGLRKRSSSEGTPAAEAPATKAQSTKAPTAKAPQDSARRRFLGISALTLAGTALRAQEKKADGGLAAVQDKQAPERSTPIVPAGAQSLRHLSQHCTACQLCVSTCPNGVLRPSTRLECFMQPESSYERGYCRPECTLCSQVCPTGAISRITPEEKSSIQVGHAVWVKDRCLPANGGDSCGNCARHCPAGAIRMVHLDPDDKNSPRIPVVNTERCIGCGACENLCPVRPLSAIYVEGHQRHKTI